VGAAASKGIWCGGVANPPKAAGTPGRRSTADAQLLQALAAKIGTLTAAMSATAPAPGSGTAPPAAPGTPAPASLPIDSTQTVRPLTPLELADAQASHWFAIQLLLCADRINPAEVPNLGIFEEYRLYSVSGPDHDRLMHALRLGFFSSARYLAAYFPAPTIKRVSIAERERFADKVVIAGKNVGASGDRAVIELDGHAAPVSKAPGVAAPAAAPVAAAPVAAAPVAAPVADERPAGFGSSWLWSLLPGRHRAAD